MKELLEYILKSLVVYPDDIAVEEQVLADGLTIFSISANKEDYGRVIGRQGMIIQALRTIVKARAIKEKKKVMVRVMTDDVKEINDKTDEKAEVAPESLDDSLV